MTLRMFLRRFREVLASCPYRVNEVTLSIGPVTLELGRRDEADDDAS